MAADKEVGIEDAELEALMAELEVETSGAVAVPAVKPAVKPTVEPAAEPAVAAAHDPEAATACETPKGKDPLENEESNFVVPANVKAVADPPAWGDSAIDPADRPDAGAQAQPAAAATTAAAAPVASDWKTPTDAQNTSVKKPAPVLRYGIDPNTFKVETAVSDVNLDQCMIEQSSLRATYGALLANAEAQAARVKLRVEVKEAQLYDQHRKALAASGEKVTEKMVENAVKTDPLWIKLHTHKIDADSIADINKHLVKSLDDRRDMLIQLGADRREEGKGQLRIMQDRELRERAVAAARTN